MNKRCVKCGSYAFNLGRDGIDQGDLCDVCYWRTICEEYYGVSFKLDAATQELTRLRAENAELRGELMSMAMQLTPTSENEALRADAERVDYLEKYAVIAKPGESVRHAIDAAIDAARKE